MRGALAASRLGLVVWAVARGGQAATTGAPGEVSFRQCAPRDAKEIARLIAVDQAASSAEGGPSSTQVAVVCRGARFDIEVATARGAPRNRSVDLQQTPPSARLRLVAIAVAELLAASDIDDPLPVVTPPASPPVDQVPLLPPAPTTSCCRVRGEVMGSARAFSGGEELAGGGLRFALGRDLPVAFDVLVEYGSRAVSGGTMGMLSATAGVTYGLHSAWGATSWSVAAGLRGGAALLRGHPNAGGELIAADPARAWGGPMLQVAVAFAPRERMVVELLLESGYALFPVYALVDQQRQGGLHGVWAGAQLAFGLDR